MISVWPKLYSFDPEMVLHFHFTFKPFSGHAQKKEREKERRESRDCPKPSSPISSADITGTAPIAITRSVDRDRTKHRPRWSWSYEATIAIAQSVDHDRVKHQPCRLQSRLRVDRDRAKCPDLMIFFWVLFVFWGMNDILYLFGNRENVSNK